MYGGSRKEGTLYEERLPLRLKAYPTTAQKVWRVVGWGEASGSKTCVGTTNKEKLGWVGEKHTLCP